MKLFFVLSFFFQEVICSLEENEESNYYFFFSTLGSISFPDYDLTKHHTRIKIESFSASVIFGILFEFVSIQAKGSNREDVDPET